MDKDGAQKVELARHDAINDDFGETVESVNTGHVPFWMGGEAVKFFESRDSPHCTRYIHLRYTVPGYSLAFHLYIVFHIVCVFYHVVYQMQYLLSLQLCMPFSHLLHISSVMRDM